MRKQIDQEKQVAYGKSAGCIDPMRFLVEYRFVLSLALSAITGVIGLHAWPFPAQNVLLASVQARQPGLYASFAYAYATV
jgi:hypothetical protein